MSATEAITAARTAGVRLTADGEDLLLDAASPPSVAVIDTLSRHKAEVLKLLRPAGNGWSAADWHAFFDERAIAEFDDGLSRSEAEDHAFTCSVSEWLNRNPITSPPGRCLACGDREHRASAGRRPRKSRPPSARLVPALAALCREDHLDKFIRLERKPTLVGLKENQRINPLQSKVAVPGPIAGLTSVIQRPPLDRRVDL
jgi:hypothetical protein